MRLYIFLTMYDMTVTVLPQPDSDTCFVVWLSAPANCISNETAELKVLTVSFKCVLGCSHPNRASSIGLIDLIFTLRGMCKKVYNFLHCSSNDYS